MFEKIKIIKKLKKLRNKPVNEEFLKTLRMNLGIYIGKNPISENLAGFRLSEKKAFRFFSGFRLVSVVAAAVLIVIISGAGITFASQESLPGDKLYPVKILTEEVVVAVTPNPETKAKLRIEFAGRRVKEVEEVVKKNGVNQEALNIGLSQIKKNFSKAADIVESEKNKGRDVKGIAKTVNDNLNEDVSSLKNIFNEQNRNLKNREEEIKTVINEAQKTENPSKLEDLKSQLAQVRSNKNVLETKKEEFKNSLSDEEARIEGQVGEKEAATVAIRNAENEKNDVLNLAADKNMILRPEVFNKFDDLFKKANSYFGAGDYANAKQNAKDARRSLSDVKNMIKESDKNSNEKRGNHNGSDGKNDPSGKPAGNFNLRIDRNVEKRDDSFSGNN
jgi:hypothetical protein